VAELERGLYVDGEEYIFDSDFFGLVAFDDGLQALEDLVEAVGDGSAGSSVDGSDGDAMQLAGGVEFHDAVTGYVGSRNRCRGTRISSSLGKVREGDKSLGRVVGLDPQIEDLAGKSARATHTYS